MDREVLGQLGKYATYIYCGSRVTDGLVRVLRDTSLRIPSRVSIVKVSGSDLTEFYRMPVASIGGPTGRVKGYTTRVVLSGVSGGVRVCSTRFTPRLIVQGSIGLCGRIV